MARKKSLNDIKEQYTRIVSSGDWNRIAKASEITNRYISNISKTSAYKKQKEAFSNAYYSGRGEAARDMANQIGSSKYSRREYMGLANG